jgi:hypothetical protein
MQRPELLQMRPSSQRKLPHWGPVAGPPPSQVPLSSLQVEPAGQIEPLRQSE